MAASAPCLCTDSTMSLCLRTSSSSQMSLECSGTSSLLGPTLENSVETAAHPPSARTARYAAQVAGRWVP